MSKFSLLTSIIVLGLFFTSCSKDAEQSNSNQEANEILSTNEYVLTELDKTQYVLTKESNGFEIKNAKNKILILDIFATWCPPCRAEASHLSSLQKKYKDSLVIIGVTVEHNIENKKLIKFRNNNGANYPLVNSSENSRIIDAVAAELNLGNDFGIPLMAMYKNGKLVNFYQGATEEEFIESDIKKALGI